MKALTLACSVLAVAYALSQDEEEFQSLLLRYGRKYALGSAEYDRRFVVFKENKIRIAEFSRNDPSASYAMNEFFDISKEEFQHTKKMKPFDLNLNRGSAGVSANCLGGGATVQSKYPATGLPTTFDWRNNGKRVLTPIKNQEQCGSCWAFSAVESVESLWAIKYNKLFVLSPQEVVDCSKGCINEPPYGKVCNQGCNGGWPWSAFDDIKELGGLDSEVSYPYLGRDSGSCNFKKADVQATDTNFTCISGPNTASETDMQTIMMNQGPLSICLNAEPFQFYNGGILRPTSCNPRSIDHCVQGVGWGEDNGVPYWSIRNSWGAAWGEQGFVRLYRGTNICGVANACAIPQV